MGDKSFSEAAGNVNWSDVAYSGIEVTYPKWYMAVASAIGRDILTQRLRNSTEISLLELTKKYSLIVLSNALGTFFWGDLTKVNNIDLKIKWYIKDALSYNFKFAIHSLHTNGFDRNTLEWFLSDLGFRIFTNDQKAVIEKEYE
ncbi:MAG: hypothetical protein MJZ00_01415 [Paludibacteraceae bacterium]|nr:hypothetical protein [Paludibacteraceae bacterium]